MNYERIYTKLIELRKANPAQGYIERHHILPRSMGGVDDSSNMVALTAREHWIAHLLLHKIHRLPQTAHACHMMAMRCEERGIPRIKNSRMYEAIRIECAKYASKCGKQRKGPKNGSYGTMWICNIDLKENAKIKKDESIPEGWIPGRNKWNIPKRRRDQIPREEWIEKYRLKMHDRSKEKALYYYNLFKKHKFDSINQFAKSEYCDVTQPALSILWKKHIPEYNAKKRHAFSSN